MPTIDINEKEALTIIRALSNYRKVLELSGMKEGDARDILDAENARVTAIFDRALDALNGSDNQGASPCRA
ncbi:MAG: hypothetical protein N2444_05265 [Methylocystis sp.]|nr:hypothetical protein [Methylocystis sp.]